MPVATKKTRLELVQGSSSKFWEIERTGSALTVTFGRTGTAGQRKTIELADAKAAAKEAETRIAKKRKKGYGDPAATEVGAPARTPEGTVEVTVVRKGRSSGKEFLPRALATDGAELFVHSWVRLYHRVGDGRLREVGEFGTLDEHREDLLLTSSGLYACGGAGLVRSDDGGETFEPVPLPTRESLRALAEDSVGGLWVGGGHHGTGVLFHRRADTTSFTAVDGPTDMVTCLTNTTRGLVVGDRAGALWVRTKGELAQLHDARREVRTVFETAAGTLLAVVGKPEQIDDLALVRSTDGGRTFEESALGELSILTLAQLPAGPIVAGAEWGAIGISLDDGRSFHAVPHEASFAGGQSFASSCVQNGAVVLGGPFNNLVEVRAGEAPSARPKSVSKKKRKRRAGGKRGYVASGRFAKDLEAACGALARRSNTRAEGVDEALDALPGALAAELEALHDLLHGAQAAPALCGLRLGGWVSLPAQYGMDAQDVLEAEWFGELEDAELVASYVEVFNVQGSPFVIVGEQGVFLLAEDPHEYWQVADDLETFLRTLVAVEAAARGEGSVEAAEEQLAEHVYVDEEDRYPGFFERTLEQARSR